MGRAPFDLDLSVEKPSTLDDGAAEGHGLLGESPVGRDGQRRPVSIEMVSRPHKCRQSVGHVLMRRRVGRNVKLDLGFPCRLEERRQGGWVTNADAIGRDAKPLVGVVLHSAPDSSTIRTRSSSLS